MPAKLYTRHDVQSLLAFAETVEDLGARMRGLAEGLKEHGFTEVEVTYYASATKALEYLANFNHGIQQALIEARKDRGDFEAKPPVSDAKPTSRKKRG